jgi:PAS domain S-box-containing protein
MANGAGPTFGFPMMEGNRSRGGVARWVVLLSLFLAALLAANAAIVERFLAADDASGPLLVLASRQAFLCQRMEFQLERALAGDAEGRKALREAAAEYEKTLRQLETGGELEGRIVPPRHQALAGPLSTVRATWGRLRYPLENIPASPSNETRDEVLLGMKQLVEGTAALGTALDEWRHAARRNLFFLVAATSLVGFAALAFWSMLAWDRLVAPVRRLRDTVLSAMERPSTTVPSNEIEAVAQAVTELSSDMDRLRRERARMRNELRRAEADYEAIFDNAVAGILRSDAEGAILMANRALARILGFSSVEDLMAKVTDVHRQLFVDPNHRARFEELHRKRGHVELETRVRRKDGSDLWVLESGNVGESRDGSQVYETVLVDITPMKQAQESLRQLSALLLRSQDQERRRIARELHDSTGQLLAALAINLGRLDEVMPMVRESLSSSVDLASECTRQIRSMSYLLHPPMLEELGLLYALRDYTRGFSQRSGVDVALDAPAEMSRLSPDTELALFRVVQEALANIQRHSESRDAIVRIVSGSRSIRLEVEDHGRGIAPDLLTSNGEPSLAKMGVGLRGMEERLRHLGGRVTVESRRGRTLVRAEVPIGEEGSGGRLPVQRDPGEMPRFVP